MTLNQLDSLTEDEKVVLWYVVNHIFPPSSPQIEYSPRNITWLKHDILIIKLRDAFPKVKVEAHPIYSSLLTKLGVQHEIKYEQPPAPAPTQVSSSI